MRLEEFARLALAMSESSIFEEVHMADFWSSALFIGR